MMRFAIGTSVTAALVLAAGSTGAQVARNGYALPLSLAMEAAAEAVRACESNGYAVSAAVVDVSGVVKVQAKGDHSTIHTRDSSFRKAYTVVTLGPIFHFDASSTFAELGGQESCGAGDLVAAGYPPARRRGGYQGWRRDRCRIGSRRRTRRRQG